MAMQSVSDAISLVVALGESLGKLSLMSTDNMDAVIDALPLTREAKPVVTPAGRYVAFLGAWRGQVLILCEQEELKGDAGAVYIVRIHVETILTSTIGILWRA